jgi:hypothetical protein
MQRTAAEKQALVEELRADPDVRYGDEGLYGLDHTEHAHVYQSLNDLKWYWHAIDGNNRKTATDGSQGYDHQQDALDGAIKHNLGVPIVVLTADEHGCRG